MNPNKALWEKGDFTRIAETMRDSSEALVKELQITNGLEVLDLGCGDGNTALPAARLGANVLGVDIAANDGVIERMRPEHASYGIVVDMRQAPPRNDPEFESAMAKLRAEI